MTEATAKLLSTCAHSLCKLPNWAACTSVTKVSNPVQLLTSWTWFLGLAHARQLTIMNGGRPASSSWLIILVSSCLLQGWQGPRGGEAGGWPELLWAGIVPFWNWWMFQAVFSSHGCFKDCWSLLTSSSLDGSNCISISALSPTAASSTLKKAGS